MGVDVIGSRVDEMLKRLSNACLPGSYLVEYFPIILHLPDMLAKWKREGKEFFKKDTIMFEGLMDSVRMKLHAGETRACFATVLIEDEKKYDLGAQKEAWLAGTILYVMQSAPPLLFCSKLSNSLAISAAGAETVGGPNHQTITSTDGIVQTAATLTAFFLAAVLYPGAMHKAQIELDAVVGPDRVPRLEDRARLPYIEALVKEVLRWRPVTPMGLSRRADQDDWYNGYLIPKGTLVIWNTWNVSNQPGFRGMNRDPKYFPDYEEFRPERYLDDAGQLSEPIPDTHAQGHFTYGSGRR
ncbi:hypothetical protein PHLCEN_2v7676 [Hermanssonia centrifuga]|uniref:Cytochrome P450 n=1 Tax=Hermanssonia centrifuga TaxID=98765 RepID=A0A2R6NVU4_9APHY|nr:hypothetical protein PHLCEN_2v7676 [Hermanssonia centrifuga]